MLARELADYAARRSVHYGWVVAALNSVLICVIGVRTSQFGFVPANLFCIVLYAWNYSRWRNAGEL